MAIDPFPLFYSFCDLVFLLVCQFHGLVFEQMIQMVKILICVSDSVNDFGVENLENLKEVSSAIKILSYNVWFAEDLEVHRRMQAIGDLIRLHTPDVICLQVYFSWLLYIIGIFGFFVFCTYNLFFSAYRRSLRIYITFFKILRGGRSIVVLFLMKGLLPRFTFACR